MLAEAPATFEWYQNDWIKLVVMHPDTKELYLFEKDTFRLYSPHHSVYKSASDLQRLVESSHENIAVHQLTNS